MSMQVSRARRYIPIFILLACLWPSLLLLGCQQQTSPATRQELIAQAEAHLKAGRFHEALTELNQALQTDPKNTEVHLNLGWLYYYTDQPEKALAEIETIDRLDPDNPQVHALKGAVYAKLQDWEKALTAYRDALKVDVNNPALHGSIAQTFIALDDPEAALHEYKVAAKLDPTETDYAFGQCMTLRQLREYQQALGACQLALSLSQDEKEKERITEVTEQLKLLESLQPKSDNPATEPTRQ